MRYGIPLLGERVAPRCRCADGILIVASRPNRRPTERWLPLEITVPMDLISVLKKNRIDAVVCGGISREERETLAPYAPTIIENVACSAGEALAALKDGSLRPGFGFAPADRAGRSRIESGRAASPPGRALPPPDRTVPEIDCLRCDDKKCLRGEVCTTPSLRSATALPPSVVEVLEAATDVSTENERKLCRLAELVYFCQEMGFRKIGIAFCVELQEPAEIVAGVLGRSFDTVGACCKIGGIPRSEPQRRVRPGTPSVPPIACNPVAQARLLNQAQSELNVIVGLCMGADCIFARESDAPVTALFVKDKSLANNPIGAVYSEYYLRESVSPSWRNELAHRAALDAVSGREERS
jgi:uncharacterized metal-binding protein